MMQFYLFMFILTLIQSIAILPLRKLGIPYSYILLFASSFLVITSGVTYYIDPFLNIGSPFIISFISALILEYLLFSVVINFSDCFLRLNVTLKNKKYFFEIFILFTIITILMVIFSNIYTKEAFLKFGDFNDFVKLVEFISIYKQDFFSLTYTDIGQNEPRLGLFYPYAGFIISSLAYTLLDLSAIDATYYLIIFISFYSYIFSMYVLIKILKIPNLYTMLTYLLLANIFPIGLIFSGNISSIYGIIGSISGLILINLCKASIKPTAYSIIVILLLIIILPLHPSAVVTFIFFIIAINTIFQKLDIKKLKLFIYSLLGILIGGIAIIASSVSFGFIHSKSLDSIHKVWYGFIKSLPNRISLEDFLSEASLHRRALEFFWTNVVSLSSWEWLIPTSLILWVSIIYSYFKFSKEISYFFPLLFYLYLIISSSTSGIHGLRFISFLSIPYYQSPARILHIGVLLYFLYLGRFLIDKEEELDSLIRKYKYFIHNSIIKFTYIRSNKKI